MSDASISLGAPSLRMTSLSLRGLFSISTGSASLWSAIPLPRDSHCAGPSFILSTSHGGSRGRQV
eukprot:87944-Karenia_brevis.AAC.1